MRFMIFWYGNAPGNYPVGDESVSRLDIRTYGGPDPDFESCDLCQTGEWMSRIKQENRFVEHECDTSNACRTLCQKQGDELWANLHRNHRFARGCDPCLSAPRGLVLLFDEPRANLWKAYNMRGCQAAVHMLQAQLAQTTQIDVVSKPPSDYSNYDFLFMVNTGNSIPLFKRPSIPIVVYHHDMWGHGFQEVIDYFQPDYFLTPFPTPWQMRFDIPETAKVWFYPLLTERFYTRPNLNDKTLDLLVVGLTSIPRLYAPRVRYAKQIESLISEYRIGFSHKFGARSTFWPGPAVTDDGTHYMNKWSEYLGSAKFVTFGPCTPPYASEFTLLKYGECISSGAIPIMPTTRDLNLLGLQPMEHYIPVGNVWGDNTHLRYYLDHYDDYKYIAEQGIVWYERHADWWIYDHFESLIQEVTEFRYPRRLI